jgi:hypothetical protein
VQSANILQQATALFNFVKGHVESTKEPTEEKTSSQQQSKPSTSPEYQLRERTPPEEALRNSTTRRGEAPQQHQDDTYQKGMGLSRSRVESLHCG